MSKYLYEKYTSVVSHYSQGTWSGSITAPSNSTHYNIIRGITKTNVSATYSFSSTGYYLSGYIVINDDHPIPVNRYYVYSNSLYQVLTNSRSNSSYRTISRTTVYKKGALVGAVIVEDGTYPSDGRHSDGYWYVRKGLAFPTLEIKIDGNIKVSDYGWTKVDGQLKQVEKIWTKINGVLKEV